MMQGVADALRSSSLDARRILVARGPRAFGDGFVALLPQGTCNLSSVIA